MELPDNGRLHAGTLLHASKATGVAVGDEGPADDQRPVDLLGVIRSELLGQVQEPVQA